MINHVVLMLKFFYWHLHDNIFVQNKRICSNQTTFVTFGSYFQSHNRNLSLWSYSWIKPLSSRFVVPIPVSWFSLADFGELNPYTGHVRCEMTLLHWIPAPCDAYLIWRNIFSVTYPLRPPGRFPAPTLVAYMVLVEIPQGFLLYLSPVCEYAPRNMC